MASENLNSLNSQTCEKRNFAEAEEYTPVSSKWLLAQAVDVYFMKNKSKQRACVWVLVNVLLCLRACLCFCLRSCSRAEMLAWLAGWLAKLAG